MVALWPATGAEKKNIQRIEESLTLVRGEDLAPLEGWTPQRREASPFRRRDAGPTSRVDPSPAIAWNMRLKTENMRLKTEKMRLIKRTCACWTERTCALAPSGGGRAFQSTPRDFRD